MALIFLGVLVVFTVSTYYIALTSSLMISGPDSTPQSPGLSGLGEMLHTKVKSIIKRCDSSNCSIRALHRVNNLARHLEVI